MPKALPRIVIGILGLSGRMGRAVGEVALQKPGIEKVWGTYHQQKPLHGGAFTWRSSKETEEIFKQSHVVMDFSDPTAASQHLDFAIKNKKPFLLGTTGFQKDQQHTLQKKMAEASRVIPILQAANTSLATALLHKLARLCTSHLYDRTIRIIEEHHQYKKDKPSGTALALKETIIQNCPQPAHASIHIVSVRRGEMCGTHKIFFTNDHEEICLSHHLFDRKSLAEGGVIAGLWLSDKKEGLYTMDNLLQE